MKLMSPKIAVIILVLANVLLVGKAHAEKANVICTAVANTAYSIKEAVDSNMMTHNEISRSLANPQTGLINPVFREVLSSAYVGEADHMTPKQFRQYHYAKCHNDLGVKVTVPLAKQKDTAACDENASKARILVIYRDMGMPMERGLVGSNTPEDIAMGKTIYTGKLKDADEDTAEAYYRKPCQ
jgi:hypothetical protein